MAGYKLSYAGEWRESFAEPAAAIARAREVAADGHVVEVARRRFGFHSFYTAFPETERDSLRRRWRTMGLASDGGGGDGSAVGHHHNSMGGHGAGHGDGHGGGGHGGH